MKILLLSKYSRLGASSRLRTLQYIPELEKQGIQVDRYPLFDNAYLTNLYSGQGRSLTSLMKYYWQRTQSLRQSGLIDLLWIEKEAFPYLPFWLENLLLPADIPTVLDFDDAIFHNYDLSGHRIIRVLLGNKIDRLMAEAACVVCGNDYLVERAQRTGAARVEKVPTVVDLQRYSVSDSAPNEVPIIGWIGSPSTQQYVLDLKPTFEKICAGGKARVVLVGVQPDMAMKFGTASVEILPWREETEVQVIKSFDIGIMPLPDGPWERGKCGYKLIQYMACGKPVVASPVGVNVDIVERWQCGYLAGGLVEWERSLTALLGDVELRNKLGANGRHAVETHFSLQVQAPRLIEILQQIAKQGLC